MAGAPDEQLASAIAACREAEALERRLAAAQARADESAARVEAAGSRLVAEHQDVRRLESFSLTKVLSHLNGSYEDDVAREVAERQIARYEYLTERARADVDQHLVDQLAERLAALGDVALALERAYADKERWLRDNDGPGAARLIEIAPVRGQLTSELKELDEASAAGGRALAELRSAAEQLDEARAWSVHDTWSSGGFVTSAIKIDKLDRLSATLRSADAELRRFSTEFADVQMDGGQVVELSSAAKVFDVWFDNFFTDAVVHQRVIRTQEQVDHAITGLGPIVAELDARIRSRVDELARLEAERANLLQ